MNLLLNEFNFFFFSSFKQNRNSSFIQFMLIMNGPGSEIGDRIESKLKTEPGHSLINMIGIDFIAFVLLIIYNKIGKMYKKDNF